MVQKPNRFMFRKLDSVTESFTVHSYLILQMITLLLDLSKVTMKRYLSVVTWTSVVSWTVTKILFSEFV